MKAHRSFSAELFQGLTFQQRMAILDLGISGNPYETTKLTLNQDLQMREIELALYDHKQGSQNDSCFEISSDCVVIGG